MTGLLAAAAAITLITLLISATSTVSNATPSDAHRRGTWGVLRFTMNRVRPLNSHERRWQTSLLSGKDNESRWRDLVEEIEALEKLSNVSRKEGAPDSFDSAWVETMLSSLEAAMAEKTQPGDRQ